MESIQSNGRGNPYDDIGVSEEYDENANFPKREDIGIVSIIDVDNVKTNVRVNKSKTNEEVKQAEPPNVLAMFSNDRRHKVFVMRNIAKTIDLQNNATNKNNACAKFLVIGVVMVTWLALSVLLSLPLLYIPNSLSVFVKTPYIALWIAVLSHSMIYKKMLSVENKLHEFLTLKSFILFLILWFFDSSFLTALIWFITYCNITDGPQYFALI
jgi:hypothetical protein